MAAMWTCGQCRSINQPRDSRCYACRTPRTVAEVDPLKLSATSRAPVAAGPIGTYQSTLALALLTSILILGAAVVSVATSVMSLGVVDAALAGERVPAQAGDAIGTGTIATLGVVAIAVLAWAAWLSRASANLPALGVGYSRTSPGFVLVESLIPVYNVFKAHLILTDILRRIRPVPRDTVAVLAAWLPLALTVLLTVGFLRLSIMLRSIVGADSLARIAVLVREISLGLQIVSAIFLVVLIWRVEARMRGRAAEIRLSTAATAS